MLLRMLTVPLLLLVTLSPLAGQVLQKPLLMDKQTGQPVPFANIRYLPQGGGTYSDEKGFFVWKEADILEIRHPAYSPLILATGQVSDTVYLTGSSRPWPPAEVVRPARYPEQPPRFAKNHRVYFNLAAFEVGLIIPRLPDTFRDILIPYAPPARPTLVGLNLHRLVNNRPGKLLYREVQLVAPGTHQNPQYLRFANPDTIRQMAGDQPVFVSVELLDPDYGSGADKVRLPPGESMLLYLNYRQSATHTFTTWNFSLEPGWKALQNPERKKRSPNLTCFVR